jgi:hypothetical protein
MMGRAVSPVTSYVAFEPGTRPSTDGFDDRGTFGGLLGSGAGELGGGFGFGRNATRLPFEKLVDVAHCVTAVHPKASWSVDFTVETTKDEIVDVAAKDTNAMAVCLVESVWNVRLDASYMLDHETHAFTLRGPAAP